MKRPRLSFGMRTLIVIVAVAAGCVAVPVAARRGYYLEQARLHAALAKEFKALQGPKTYPGFSEWLGGKHAYHRMLQERYEGAASRPWERDPLVPNSIGGPPDAPLTLQQMNEPGPPPPPSP